MGEDEVFEGLLEGLEEGPSHLLLGWDGVEESLTVEQVSGEPLDELGRLGVLFLALVQESMPWIVAAAKEFFVDDGDDEG